MKKDICDYCGGDVVNENCVTCLASYKINYDLLLTLMFFFSLPSLFIVKGTGNLWYLTSSFIGAFIYLFNIRYIRNDEKTIREYEYIKEKLRKIERYKSGELGVISLASTNHILKSKLMEEISNDDLASSLLSSYGSIIHPPSISKQLSVVGGTKNILEFNELVESEYLNFSLVIKKSISEHKDIN